MSEGAQPPEELKFISTYLLRGKEVETKDPIISYYCRLYAVKLAVEKSPTSKEAQTFILDLMDHLEKDKAALCNEEAIQNETIGYAHVENFALKIFLTADNEDRNGQATKKTAKTFLAASTFLEILKTFGDGELDSEVTQKIKYAKYKVADLMKAFKEGRVPQAGPPGGELDTGSPTIVAFSPNANANAKADRPSEPTNVNTSSDPHKKIPVYQPSAPSGPIDFTKLAVDDNEDEQDIGYSEHDRKAIQSAGKHAKFAMSALLYDDVRTAIQNLEQALAMLKPIKIIEDLVE